MQESVSSVDICARVSIPGALCGYEGRIKDFSSISPVETRKGCFSVRERTVNEPSTSQRELKQGSSRKLSPKEQHIKLAN